MDNEFNKPESTEMVSLKDEAKDQVDDVVYFPKGADQHCLFRNAKLRFLMLYKAHFDFISKMA